MDTLTLIFALGAGAFCLLAYPGIFSRLSNDGKLRSPASFINTEYNPPFFGWGLFLFGTLELHRIHNFPIAL